MLHTLIIFFVLMLGAATGYVVGFVQGYEHCKKNERRSSDNSNSSDVS